MLLLKEEKRFPFHLGKTSVSTVKDTESGSDQESESEDEWDMDVESEEESQDTNFSEDDNDNHNTKQSYKDQRFWLGSSEIWHCQLIKIKNVQFNILLVKY